MADTLMPTIISYKDTPLGATDGVLLKETVVESGGLNFVLIRFIGCFTH